MRARPIGGFRMIDNNQADVEITHVYGREEALDLISRSREDYMTWFENLDTSY